MRMALFTVSFAGLWGQHKLSLEDSIEEAASLGYQGIEIMGKRPHLSVLDYTLADCEKLRRRIDQLNLKVAAIAGYTNFTGGMEAGEVPFVEMQVNYVEALAQRAQVLGCDLVRVFTSYERQDVPFLRQWQITLDALRQCCDRAAPLGVRIGVQNHHDIAVDSQTYDELLRGVGRDNLLPMYDCWSVHLRGEDVAAGAKQFAPRMPMTTVADYCLLPRWRYRPELVNYERLDPPAVLAVPMGEGALDYKTFFTALKAAGFHGWVSYEMCSPLRDGGNLETLRRYAAAFLTYMRPLA